MISNDSSLLNPATVYIINVMIFFQELLRNPPQHIYRIHRKLYFTEQGLTEEYIPYVSFKEYFSKHIIHDVTSINSAEEALIFLLQEESVRQPRFCEPESVTHEMLRTHILFQYLFHMIHEYINSGFSVDQINYEKLNELHKRYVYYNAITERQLLTLAPIVGIKVSNYPFAITDDLIVEKLDIETKNSLVNSFNSRFEISYIENAECCLKFKKVVKQGQSLNISDNDLTIRAFLTASRLYKEGDVAIFQSYTLPAETYTNFLGELVGVVSSSIFADYYLPRGSFDSLRINNNCIFNNEDRSSLGKIYTQCKKIVSGKGNFNALQIPISRFHMTYARESDDDRVIDLAIVLESTLLHGINDELSNRIGLRGAALLKDHANLFEIRDLLKALYVVRSKIVHEGQTIKNQAKDGKIRTKYNVDSFVVQLRGVVRSILIKYLERMSDGSSIKKISDGLEDELLHSLAQNSRAEK